MFEDLLNEESKIEKTEESENKMEEPIKKKRPYNRKKKTNEMEEEINF